MKKKLILALIFAALCTVPALAQRTGVTLTTFANLPATCTPQQPFVVSDANATCTAGSGSARWCLCTDAGNAYEPDPGGTPGPDSVGTSQLNDGTDTPLAGEWVQVDAGDTSRFSYRTDGELLTDTGAAPLASPTFTGDPLGPTPSVGDNDTSLVTSAFVQGEIRGWWQWGAFDMSVDGTNCKSPVGVTINGGPIIGAIDCDDDVASILYGDAQLEVYDGGDLVFTLLAINTNATPSGILDFDISAQCRGNDDLVNSTWGSVQNAAITFATQNDLMHADTAAVTPDGTCAAGDTIFWRAVMDATATTTEVADVEIITVSLRES